MTDYSPPTVTVDGVVFQLQGAVLQVLLIKRAKDPFKGAWALPGGYCSRDETTTEALHRILHAKAGIAEGRLGLIEQLYTFDTPAYSPAGNAVSVVYIGLGRDIVPNSPTMETPTFFPVHDLPDVVFEHARIITHAHQRLQGKITYTNTVYALLPETFTLTQLQAAYEAIFGHRLDKRNFRKKFLALELIKPTNTYATQGAHRPAQLYRFTNAKLRTLSRSFE